jgi:hypothetical protein
MKGAVYHVTQNGVEAIQSFRSPETHYVAFVDGDDEDDSVPKYFLFSSSVQIIVASFPKGAKRWLKNARKFNYGEITKFATSLWSPHELFLTGLVLMFLLSMLD